MRDTLPLILRHLRNDCATVLNAIAEYERLTLREEWGAMRRDTQDKALKNIENRMQQACDRLGLLPSERWALQEQIARLQSDNARLTAANVAAMEGRKVA